MLPVIWFPSLHRVYLLIGSGILKIYNSSFAPLVLNNSTNNAQLNKKLDMNWEDYVVF